MNFKLPEIRSNNFNQIAETNNKAEQPFEQENAEKQIAEAPLPIFSNCGDQAAPSLLAYLMKGSPKGEDDVFEGMKLLKGMDLPAELSGLQKMIGEYAPLLKKFAEAMSIKEIPSLLPEAFIAFADHSGEGDLEPMASMRRAADGLLKTLRLLENNNDNEEKIAADLAAILEKEGVLYFPLTGATPAIVRVERGRGFSIIHPHMHSPVAVEMVPFVIERATGSHKKGRWYKDNHHDPLSGRDVEEFRGQGFTSYLAQNGGHVGDLTFFIGLIRAHRTENPTDKVKLLHITLPQYIKGKSVEIPEAVHQLCKKEANDSSSAPMKLFSALLYYAALDPFFSPEDAGEERIREFKKIKFHFESKIFMEALTQIIQEDGWEAIDETLVEALDNLMRRLVRTADKLTRKELLDKEELSSFYETCSYFENELKKRQRPPQPENSLEISPIFVEEHPSFAVTLTAAKRNGKEPLRNNAGASSSQRPNKAQRRDKSSAYKTFFLKTSIPPVEALIDFEPQLRRADNYVPFDSYLSNVRTLGKHFAKLPVPQRGERDEFWNGIEEDKARDIHMICTQVIGYLAKTKVLDSDKMAPEALLLGYLAHAIQLKISARLGGMEIDETMPFNGYPLLMMMREGTFAIVDPEMQKTIAPLLEYLIPGTRLDSLLPLSKLQNEEELAKVGKSLFGFTSPPKEWTITEASDDPTKKFFLTQLNKEGIKKSVIDLIEAKNRNLKKQYERKDISLKKQYYYDTESTVTQLYFLLNTKDGQKLIDPAAWELFTSAINVANLMQEPLFSYLGSRNNLFYTRDDPLDKKGNHFLEKLFIELTATNPKDAVTFKFSDFEKDRKIEDQHTLFVPMNDDEKKSFDLLLGELKETERKQNKIYTRKPLCEPAALFRELLMISSDPYHTVMRVIDLASRDWNLLRKPDIQNYFFVLLMHPDAIMAQLRSNPKVASKFAKFIKEGVKHFKGSRDYRSALYLIRLGAHFKGFCTEQGIVLKHPVDYRNKLLKLIKEISDHQHELLGTAYKALLSLHGVEKHNDDEFTADLLACRVAMQLTKREDLEKNFYLENALKMLAPRMEEVLLFEPRFQLHIRRPAALDAAVAVTGLKADEACEWEGEYPSYRKGTLEIDCEQGIVSDGEELITQPPAAVYENELLRRAYPYPIDESSYKRQRRDTYVFNAGKEEELRITLDARGKPFVERRIDNEPYSLDPALPEQLKALLPSIFDETMICWVSEFQDSVLVFKEGERDWLYKVDLQGNRTKTISKICRRTDEHEYVPFQAVSSRFPSSLFQQCDQEAVSSWQSESGEIIVNFPDLELAFELPSKGKKTYCQQVPGFWIDLAGKRIPQLKNSEQIALINSKGERRFLARPRGEGPWLELHSDKEGLSSPHLNERLFLLEMAARSRSYKKLQKQLEKINPLQRLTDYQLDIIENTIELLLSEESLPAKCLYMKLMLLKENNLLLFPPEGVPKEKPKVANITITPEWKAFTTLASVYQSYLKQAGSAPFFRLTDEEERQLLDRLYNELRNLADQQMGFDFGFITDVINPFKKKEEGNKFDRAMLSKQMRNLASNPAKLMATDPDDENASPNIGRFFVKLQLGLIENALGERYKQLSSDKPAKSGMKKVTFLNLDPMALFEAINLFMELIGREALIEKMTELLALPHSQAVDPPQSHNGDMMIPFGVSSWEKMFIQRYTTAKGNDDGAKALLKRELDLTTHERDPYRSLIEKALEQPQECPDLDELRHRFAERASTKASYKASKKALQGAKDRLKEAKDDLDSSFLDSYREVAKLEVKNAKNAVARCEREFKEAQAAYKEADQKVQSLFPSKVGTVFKIIRIVPGIIFNLLPDLYKIHSSEVRLKKCSYPIDDRMDALKAAKRNKEKLSPGENNLSEIDSEYEAIFEELAKDPIEDLADFENWLQRTIEQWQTSLEWERNILLSQLNRIVGEKVLEQKVSRMGQDYSLDWDQLVKLSIAADAESFAQKTGLDKDEAEKTLLAIGEHLIRATRLQQLKRVKAETGKALKQPEHEAIYKENIKTLLLMRREHKPDPSNLKRLWFEYNNMYMYRKEQLEKIEDALSRKNPELIVKLPTGFGKTKTIVPTIDGIVAETKQVYNEHPPSIAALNSEDLAKQMEGIGIKAGRLHFQRSTHFGVEALKKLYDEMQKCFEGNAPINCSPDDIRSIELHFISTLDSYTKMLEAPGFQRNSKAVVDLREQIKYFILIQRMIRVDGFATIDEAHEALSSRYKLIYTVGEPQPLQPGRAEVITDLFCWLMERPKYAGFIQTNTQRLITLELFNEMAQGIADHFCEKFRIPEERKEEYLDFVLRGAKPTDYISTHPRRSDIALVKGELYLILKNSLEGSVDKDFGRSILHFKSKPFSGPFAFANEPKENSKGPSQYQNPDEALNATCLTELHKSIPVEETRELLAHLKREQQRESEEKGNALPNTEAYRIYKSIYDGKKELSLLTDHDIRDLIPLFQRHPRAVAYYIKEFVATKMEIYPETVESTGQNHRSQFSASHSLSATPQPIEAHGPHSDLIGMEEMDKQTEECFRKKVAQDHFHFAENEDPHTVLETVAKRLLEDTRLKAIIDIGALFKGLSNEKIAADLRSALAGHETVKAIQYFDIKREKFVQLNIATGKIRDAEDSDLDPMELITIYDHSRCFGSDLKQWALAHGILLIDEEVDMEGAAQGGGRMREWHKEQGIQVLMSRQTAQKIFGEAEAEIGKLLDHWQEKFAKRAKEKIYEGLIDQMENEVRRALLDEILGIASSTNADGTISLTVKDREPDIDYAASLHQKHRSELIHTTSYDPWDMYANIEEVEPKDQLEAIYKNVKKRASKMGSAFSSWRRNMQERLDTYPRKWREEAGAALLPEEKQKTRGLIGNACEVQLQQRVDEQLHQQQDVQPEEPPSKERIPSTWDGKKNLFEAGWETPYWNPVRDAFNAIGTFFAALKDKYLYCLEYQYLFVAVPIFVALTALNIVSMVVSAVALPILIPIAIFHIVMNAIGVATHYFTVCLFADHEPLSFEPDVIDVNIEPTAATVHRAKKLMDKYLPGKLSDAKELFSKDLLISNNFFQQQTGTWHIAPQAPFTKEQKPGYTLMIIQDKVGDKTHLQVMMIDQNDSPFFTRKLNDDKERCSEEEAATRTRKIALYDPASAMITYEGKNGFEPDELKCEAFISLAAQAKLINGETEFSQEEIDCLIKRAKAVGGEKTLKFVEELCLKEHPREQKFFARTLLYDELLRV